VSDRADHGWTPASLERERQRLAGTAGWKHYERARVAVLRMNELASASSGPSAPSAYWREELRNFEYMLDASPLIVDRLRQHTHHVTGVRVYEYRSNRDVMRRRFTDKLSALRKRGGDDLLVWEAPELGGFGFEADGHLFNIDTLKFYEALIALRDGAVLQDLRATTDRRLVWEIGGGWGGFAYQLETLCPNVTYVITDFPELFLFSATYLMTLFPECRVRFFGDVPAERLFDDWESIDFVFVPNYALDSFGPPRLDLTLNMVSFQEMTRAQVEGYVRRSHELGAPFLYSLNREKSSYNTEIDSVSSIIDRWYWPHDVSPMPMGYQRMLDEPPAPNDYRHIVGWRRVVPA